MKILLDTNFLLIPGQFGIDIFEGIDRAIEEKAEFYVPDAVIAELERIIKSSPRPKDRQAAKIGLELSKRAKIIKTESIKNVDNFLLKTAQEGNFAVATMDKNLKTKLKKENIPVLILRQKKYIKMV